LQPIRHLYRASPLADTAIVRRTQSGTFINSNRESVALELHAGRG
jgi:hypothetical protein